MKKFKVFMLSAFALCAVATSVVANTGWTYANTSLKSYNGYYNYRVDRANY